MKGYIKTPKVEYIKHEDMLKKIRRQVIVENVRNVTTNLKN